MQSIFLRSDVVRHIAATEQLRLTFEEQFKELISVNAEYLRDAILNVSRPSAQRDPGRRRQREGEDDHDVNENDDEKSKSRSLSWANDVMLTEIQQLRQQQKKQWIAVQVAFVTGNDFASVLRNLILCATFYLPSREWYRILYLARECAKLLFPSSYVQQSPHPPESSRTFNLGHNISFKGNDEDNNSAFCILNNIELSDSGYEKVCDGVEAKLDRLQDDAGGLLRSLLEPLMRALYCAFDIELVSKKWRKHSRNDDDDDDDVCSWDVDSETEDEKLLGRDVVQEKIAQILDAILPIHTENYLFKVERPDDEEGSIFENMAHPEGGGKFVDPRVSSQILSLLIDLSVFVAVMREGVVDSWINAAQMKTNPDGDNDRGGTNTNTSSSSSSSSASANQQVKQKTSKKLDARIFDSLFGSGLVIRGVKRDSGIVADDHSYARVVESGFSSAGGTSGKFGILAWASKWLEFPDRVCSLDPGVEQRKAELGGSFYALEQERRRRQQEKSLPQRSKANLIRSFMKNLNSLHQDQDQAEIVDDEEKESEFESVQENDSRLVCDGDDDDENMNNAKIHESKIYLLSFELVDAVLQYLLPSEIHSAALACKSWQNVVLNRIPLRRFCQLAQAFTRRINWFLRQEWGETIVLLEHKTC